MQDLFVWNLMQIGIFKRAFVVIVPGQGIAATRTPRPSGYNWPSNDTSLKLFEADIKVVGTVSNDKKLSSRNLCYFCPVLSLA